MLFGLPFPHNHVFQWLTQIIKTHLNLPNMLVLVKILIVCFVMMFPNKYIVSHFPGPLTMTRLEVLQHTNRNVYRDNID